MIFSAKPTPVKGADHDVRRSPASTRRRTRILLADDGPTSQRIAAMILESGGHTVVTADDGAAAVERVEQAAADGQPFDLVLMDMNMPVLDGYAATRQLRAAGHTLPVIALTGHTGEEHAATCRDAGCDAHLPKPYNRQQLLDAVQQHLRPAR